MPLTADRYVTSSGSNSAPYSTWATAATSIDTMKGTASAGDIVFLDSSDSFATTAGDMEWTGGTEGNPVRVFSMSNPSNVYTSRNSNGDTDGATVTSTGALFMEGWVEWYGVKFTITLDWQFVRQGARLTQRYFDCYIDVGDDCFWNSATGNTCECYHCTIEVGNRAVHGGNSGYLGARNYLYNCNIIRTGGGTSHLIDDTDGFGISNGARMIFESCDLTSWDFLVGANHANSTTTFRDCILEPGWSLNDGSFPVDHNATHTVERSSSNTDLSLPTLGLIEKATYWGTVKETDSVYRTDGASDGEQVNPISWEITTNANALEWLESVKTPWNVRWINGNASTTLTFHFASSVTLQTDELWVELTTPNEAASSTARNDWRTTRADAVGAAMNELDSSKPDPNATPTDLTLEDTNDWNGSGVSTAQKIEITFTPDIAGPIKYRFCLARPSTTIYVDPKVSVVQS